MNKRVRRVFNLLKTKAKALGFNRKELEGLAQKIDKNLQLEDNASDEDVDAAIEEAVDAAIPFLEVSQSAAQRATQQAIQRYKDRHGADDDDDDDDDDDNDDDIDDDDNQGQKRQKKNRQRTDRISKNTKDNQQDSELMKLIRAQNDAIKGLNDKIASLQGDRVAETRRTKLKKLVENTGTFGKSVIKQFDHMAFKTDDDFDDFLDDVQKDLDDLNQERANDGLNKLGNVPAGKKNPENKKPEVLSDDEIIAIAGGMNTTTKKE